MNQENIQSDIELPSMGKLIKSTILAIFIAAVILVTVVLPAEYGIDPTGVGNILGLVKMGEIKVSLALEATSEQVTEVTGQEPVDSLVMQAEKGASVEDSATKSEADVRSDEMTITLKPNQGKEIKLAMNKGEKVNYLWWTSKGRANYDAHADSKKLKINYHSYEKGSKDRSEGILEAAFDGNHGWFWRNRTAETMTVTLEVSGEYSDMMLFD